MEKSIISTGKTIDAATEAALERLGLDRDNVSVEVLETPRSGFFGIGAAPAKIRVTYEVPDEPQPVTPAPALSSASRSTGPSQYEKLQARRRPPRLRWQSLPCRAHRRPSPQSPRESAASAVRSPSVRPRPLPRPSPRWSASRCRPM